MKSLVLLSMFLVPAAFAADNYMIRITNGSGMPISPGALYVKTGQGRQTEVGKTPTPGFVQLCQTGNPDLRIDEIMRTGVASVQKTPGVVPPGESIEVPVTVASGQSIQFEAMYGKSKDLCTLISIDGEMLHNSSSKQKVIATGTDEVLATGAFSDPVVSGDTAPEADAVSRLRALSRPVENGKVHFFPGYLPSVISHLEQRYGAEDTLSLLIPASGAVRFQVVRKH